MKSLMVGFLLALFLFWAGVQAGKYETYGRMMPVVEKINSNVVTCINNFRELEGLVSAARAREKACHDVLRYKGCK